MDGLAARLGELRGELRDLRSAALDAEQEAGERIARVAPEHRDAAANMVRYCALRSRDLRGLQERLAQVGLSSLGRMEPDVLRNLDAVLAMVNAALGDFTDDAPADVGTGEAGAELFRNAAALLGGAPDDRSTRIMVTMPSDAATDAALVRSFTAAGMDLARINCAHDGPEEWAAMAVHVRSSGEDVRIAMDLGGPKLRTGPIRPGPEVVKRRSRSCDRPRTCVSC